MLRKIRRLSPRKAQPRARQKELSAPRVVRDHQVDSTNSEAVLTAMLEVALAAVPQDRRIRVEGWFQRIRDKYTAECLDPGVGPTNALAELQRVLGRLASVLRAGRRLGRPRGTKKFDLAGAMLFLAVEIMGVRPAEVLRAIGRDHASKGKDFEWLRLRVNRFRGELVAGGLPTEVRSFLESMMPLRSGGDQLTPEDVQSWRDHLTAAGSVDPRALLKEIAALNPTLFSKPKTASE